jgi:putative ABC transport system substrate-binding protein
MVLLALGLLAVSCAAQAQAARNVPRIGLVSVGADPAHPVVWFPFLERLRDLGYVDGQNIVVERRFAAGRRERLPALVADLARLQVDLIVATGTPESQAAKQALPTTPIIMMVVGDPVGTGLVASLAHPGGNVTGLSTMAPELSGKQLELLKEALPGLTRVAVLVNPADPLTAAYLQESDVAARGLGVQLHVVEVRDPTQFPAAFAAMARAQVEALCVALDAMFFNRRGQIVDLAATSRLPAMYGSREFVEGGGLMAYAASIPALSRRAADYVDKILKGAKPADLPVEQPMRFELVINLKTAQAMGLTMPPTLLFRADEVLK